MRVDAQHWHVAVTYFGYRDGYEDQPFGDVATRSGALERARNAILSTGADVAFGLEGGVELEGERVWLLSWVAAVSRLPRSREKRRS